MHRFGPVSTDGSVAVTFTTREPDPGTQVLLDVDFLLHPAWPDVDHLVLRPAAGDPTRRATTVRLPADVTLSYRYLRRDAPPVPGGDLDALRALVRTARPDPDVPDRLDDAFGSGVGASLLVGPRARPPHPVWRDGPRRHPVRRVALDGRSTLLLRGAPDRVLLVLDGDQWLDGFGLAAALERWSSPGTAVVAVRTPERGRLADRDAMRDLVLDRVLPAVGRALDRPVCGLGPVAVAGQSYGGLAAAGIVIDSAGVVGTAVAASGSFWFTPGRDARDDPRPGSLTRELARHDLTGTRFLLQVGREERGMVDQTHAFAAAARRAGARVDTVVHPGGHDHAWYRDALFDALDTW